MKKSTMVIIISIIVFIILLLIAWIGYHKFFKKPVMAAPPPATAVKVTKVAYFNLPLQVTAIGQIFAPNTMMLRAKQAGEIVGIYFTSGQWVKKGQVLVKIDDTAEQANLAQQQANYNNLLTQYSRYEKLQQKESGAVAPDVVSQKLYDTQVAKAQLDAAKKSLADTTIVAPFDGIAGALMTVTDSNEIGGQQINQLTRLTMGTYLQVDAPIVIISDPTHILVQYQIPQQYSYALQMNQPVTVQSSAYPGESFTGTTNFISPVVLESGQAFNVRAQVNNSNLKLKSGMNVLVTQVLQAQHHVIAIPALSLVPSLSGYDVYMIQDKKVKAVPVKIGQHYQTLVTIQSGLKLGDEVITSGINKVHPGSLVEVVTQ